LRAMTGVLNSSDIGQIVALDGRPNLKLWRTSQCNKIR
jgi:hypothetical protein